MNRLTVADPCDACHAAQALVTVNIATKRLDLCKHHFERHRDALLTDGAAIVTDQRDGLNPARLVHVPRTDPNHPDAKRAADKGA